MNIQRRLTFIASMFISSKLLSTFANFLLALIVTFMEFEHIHLGEFIAKTVSFCRRSKSTTCKRAFNLFV